MAPSRAMKITIPRKMSAIVLLASGCFHSSMRAVSPEDYSTTLTRSYAYSQGQCLAAVRAGVHEVGFEVASEAGSSLTTNRYEIREVSGMANNPQFHAIQMKYEFEVSGDSSSCIVRVTRFRAWDNGMEMQTMNVDYLRDHYWNPMFETISEAMSTAIVPAPDQPEQAPSQTL